VTRGGDQGETSLLYGGRVAKDDPRTEAYGDVDESISALGMARSLSEKPFVRDVLHRVQEELFTVGAELATDAGEYEKLRTHFLTVTPQMTDVLEKHISGLEERITLPDAFVVPGGSPSSAALDVARATVRRAERRIASLKSRGLLHNPEVLRYMNRLSDLLFMLARAEEGESEALTGRRVARTPGARPRIRQAPRDRPRP
jgi:cob(I)alamin adenosyltransferase